MLRFKFLIVQECIDQTISGDKKVSINRFWNGKYLRAYISKIRWFFKNMECVKLDFCLQIYTL